jgi:hypothetical protein
MKFFRPGLWIIILGSLAVCFYGMTLPLYKDEPAFQNCYQEISIESDGREVAAERFRQCRQTFLSPKISVIRYSATLLLLSGFALGLVAIGGFRVRAPRKKWVVAAIGLLSSIALGATYVADLFWDASLEVYPHWSDSIGIPIAMTPVLVVFGLVVWALNVFLIRKRKTPPNEPVFAGSWRQQNKFILAEVFVAGLLVLDTAIFGDFLGLIPNLMWFTFFAFVMAWRKGQPT